MGFNSLKFVVFFLAVYLIYGGLRRSYRAQNLFLLLASYLFYAAWDVRFLSLLAISTIVDFGVGKRLARTVSSRGRKGLVAISLVVNLGILGFFKYFDFFADSAAVLLGAMGFKASFATLNIVLPVGISFYTFQTLGYTIDVYRKKIEPCSSLVQFALFVSFFPQLVAGPIERASSLLPQIAGPRKVTAAAVQAGIFLVLWGYLKKVVIADNLAPYVETAFSPVHRAEGLTAIFGALGFMWQIYGDFSGYSDIARGVAKLLGFELMVNFKLPHFARNPQEYWVRWHISLYSWLRDYLYISLGGSRRGRLRTYANLLITMTLGGLWHGAAWHIVLWGFYHGVVLVLHRVFRDYLEPLKLSKHVAWAFDFGKIMLMTAVLLAGFIVFRAASIEHAIDLFRRLGFYNLKACRPFLYDFVFFVGPLVAVQIWQAITKDLLAPLKLKPVWRGLILAWMLLWIIIFGVRDTSQFIYFQF